MFRLLSAALVAASLTVPALSAPAAATPCDQSSKTVVHRGRTFVEKRENGNRAVYNRTQDVVTKTVTLGRSVTNSVNRHWMVGGEVEGGWGPVKAKVKGEYGRGYVRAATMSRTESLTMTIRPHHTGWVKAAFYQHVVFWKRFTWRWNSIRQACVRRTIAKAYWGAPRIQLVPVTKKGRVYPS